MKTSLTREELKCAYKALAKLEGEVERTGDSQTVRNAKILVAKLIADDVCSE